MVCKVGLGYYNLYSYLVFDFPNIFLNCNNGKFDTHFHSPAQTSIDQKLSLWVGFASPNLSHLFKSRASAPNWALSRQWQRDTSWDMTYSTWFWPEVWSRESSTLAQGCKPKQKEELCSVKTIITALLSKDHSRWGVPSRADIKEEVKSQIGGKFKDSMFFPNL